MRSTKSPSLAAINRPRRGAAPLRPISASSILLPCLSSAPGANFLREGTTSVVPSRFQIFLLVTFSLLNPAHLPASKHPTYGGTLRLELQLSKPSLDPRDWKPGSVTAAENARLAVLLYDRLLMIDDFGRFQPALAIDWSHDTPWKSWQFKLRPGVKFSDGTPLSPKDVVAALQPLLPPSMQITATETGINIHSSRAMPDLLELLASGRYFVFRVQPDGSLLGTGPFVLSESAPPTPAENPSVLKPAHLKFRANEDSWSGRPFLDSIEVTLGNPGLRQILNLQVGRADAIEFSPDLVHKARQDNLRVWYSPPTTLIALRFDESQSAASNPRLREALDLALDRDTMANVLLQRQALPAPALLPTWLSGYAFLFGTPVNLDRAKQIRASLPANVAGAADPLRLRVDATSDLLKLLGERIAVNARQANISIQIVSRSTTSTSSTPPAAGLHLLAWHYDSLSPQSELLNLSRALHLESVSDALPEAKDPDKLYSEERRLLEDRQVLPLLLLPDYVGLAPNVRNWSASPWGEWRLADVWLDTAGPQPSNNSETPQGRNTGVHP
jgi:ABC-type transport system substrate-binding protein